jgi:SPP1 gp7 family putative phage head morphogenesis protein
VTEPTFGRPPAIADPLAEFYLKDPSRQVGKPRVTVDTDDDPNYAPLALALGGAFLTAVVLTARAARKDAPSSPEEAQRSLAETIDQVFIPTFVQQATPALLRMYTEAGRAAGSLAAGHADHLADLLGAPSGEAVVTGWQQQIMGGQQPMVAWRRVLAGFGLTPRDMKTFLAADSGDTSPRSGIVGPRATETLQRLLTKRADTIGRDEMFAATSMARVLGWVSQQATGALPRAAKKKWVTAGDERVCPTCGPMDGKVVRLDEPFIMPNGVKLLAPMVHPNCRCTAALVNPRRVVISKAGTVRSPEGEEKYGDPIGTPIRLNQQQKAERRQARPNAPAPTTGPVINPDIAAQLERPKPEPIGPAAMVTALMDAVLPTETETEAPAMNLSAVSAPTKAPTMNLTGVAAPTKTAAPTMNLTGVAAPTQTAAPTMNLTEVAAPAATAAPAMNLTALADPGDPDVAVKTKVGAPVNADVKRKFLPGKAQPVPENLGPGGWHQTPLFMLGNELIDFTGSSGMGIRPGKVEAHDRIQVGDINELEDTVVDLDKITRGVPGLASATTLMDRQRMVNAYWGELFSQVDHLVQGNVNAPVDQEADVRIGLVEDIAESGGEGWSYLQQRTGQAMSLYAPEDLERGTYEHGDLETWMLHVARHGPSHDYDETLMSMMSRNAGQTEEYYESAYFDDHLGNADRASFDGDAWAHVHENPPVILEFPEGWYGHQSEQPDEQVVTGKYVLQGLTKVDLYSADFKVDSLLRLPPNVRDAVIREGFYMTAEMIPMRTYGAGDGDEGGNVGPAVFEKKIRIIPGVTEGTPR